MEFVILMVVLMLLVRLIVIESSIGKIRKAVNKTKELAATIESQQPWSRKPNIAAHAHYGQHHRRPRRQAN